MTRDSENCIGGIGVSHLLASCGALVERLYAESNAASWGVAREEFLAGLARSAQKQFGGAARAGKEQLSRYLGGLHLQDLALACACAEGQVKAWEHFVASYRSYLRAAAGAMLRCPGESPKACELADSLFADLYGLSEGKRSEKSLFRYFHGRSSLKTWLRAVLAQRHVDGIREARRFQEWDDGEAQDGEAAKPILASKGSAEAGDPHRERYVAMFTRTLEVALGLLQPRDKERLRLYYAEEETLAEIGRRFGEHESSVSRNLERIRRELRMDVERALRNGSGAGDGVPVQPGLSDAEIALCFEYAAEDAPIDLQKVFAKTEKNSVKAERKES